MAACIAERAGHLHPALYYKGLLEAAHRAGAMLCASVEAERIEKTASGWRVPPRRGRSRPRGRVATNGYTGDLTPRLKRRIVPVASHIIATEELPEDLRAGSSPRCASIGDTQRVLTYYRLSPDGKRAHLRRPRALHRRAAEESAPTSTAT